MQIWEYKDDHGILGETVATCSLAAEGHRAAQS